MGSEPAHERLTPDDERLVRGVRRDAILALIRRRASFRIDRPLARALGLSRKRLRAEVDRLIDDGEHVVRRDEFVWRPEAGTTRLALDLTDDELVAVVGGLRRLADGAPDRQLVVQASHLIHRIAAALPVRSFERLRTFGGFDAAPDPEAPPANAPEAWQAVAVALSDELKLRFLYTDVAGARSARTVWPARIANHGTCLVAWCEGREAFRTFRLDRMAEAVALDSPIPGSREALLARLRADLPERDPARGDD